MGKQERVKYLILEDSHFMSLDIQQCISILRPDFELAGEVDEYTEALKIIKNSDIDLIISEATACDGSVIEPFVAAGVDLPLILISEFEEIETLGRRCNMIYFILKPITQSEIEKALIKFEITTRSIS